jgi:hypothetical protein
VACLAGSTRQIRLVGFAELNTLEGKPSLAVVANLSPPPGKPMVSVFSDSFIGRMLAGGV